MNSNDTLRSTFNKAARSYDAIRPGYPAQLIEDVIRLSEMPENGMALEIGCGTGQATLPFARHGCRILCLDIGPDLLAIAAQNLRDYPKVQFIHSAFETWPARIGKFDLVYSATAFHWIPREIGYPKAALVLRPGGALAVFSNQHPRPYSGFFTDVDSIYAEHVPEWGSPHDLPDTQTEISAQLESIRATGLFALVEVHTYPWIKTYTTIEYITLLNTYSNHLALDDDRRAHLYQAIADLIERRYAGKVERPYLSVLYLCKKARSDT